MTLTLMHVSWLLGGRRMLPIERSSQHERNMRGSQSQSCKRRLSLEAGTQTHIVLNGILQPILVLLLLVAPWTIDGVDGSGASGSEPLNTGITKFGLYMLRSPESTVAPIGDEVMFECALNLSPERIVWRFRHLNATGRSRADDFKLIDNSMPGYNISISDLTTHLGIIVSAETVGEYQCVAWYGASGLASIRAQLMLASISLPGTASPKTNRWRIHPGNTIVISCGDVNSNPSAVWNYYRNGELIHPEQDMETGLIVLNNVQSEMSGSYWCSATNSITSETRETSIRTEVTVERTNKMAPTFLWAVPSKVSIRVGKAVTLLCPGVGNPVPKTIWSRSNGTMPSDRTSVRGHGLEIVSVQVSDQGLYHCSVDNGMSPPLMHAIELEVLQPPIIIKGPISTLTNETDVLIMDCIAVGNPTPRITWIINGEDVRWDSKIRTYNTTIYIETVEKSHAGIIQCVATNEVGEVNDANWLQVEAKPIGGTGNMPSVHEDDRHPTKVYVDHDSKGKRKHKHPTMIPPSKPSVTRLSDESAMVRWTVSSDDGLPIKFFKVQYRLIANENGSMARRTWMTCSDDIPPHLRSYEVLDLKPDHFYRFRIAAVYSNDDNKLGQPSGKFHLQRASQLSPAKSHLVVPILQKVEGVSETEIRFYWSLPNHVSTVVVGFYAYFRRASTAGEYSKATIDGMDAREFTLNYLEPGTSYEFKLQSFTASAASDFSAILTGKTLAPPTRPPPVEDTVTEDIAEKTHPNYIIIIAVLVIGLLLVVIISFCVCKRCRQRGHDSTESKAHPVDISITDNGFTGITNSLHKNNNNRSINITSNPLANDSDKNRNVMELRFLPNSNGVGSHSVVGLVQQQQQQQQKQSHAPNNHHVAATLQQQQQQQPSLIHMNYNNHPLHSNNLHFVDGLPPRRALERVVVPPPPPQSRTNHMAGPTNVGPPALGNIGIPVGIGASTDMMHQTNVNNSNTTSQHRVTGRRNSGSGHVQLTSVPGSPRMVRSGISAELLQQHHHKSPLPKRATIGANNSNNMKRNVIRPEHIMSSGSIEV